MKQEPETPISQMMKQTRRDQTPILYGIIFFLLALLAVLAIWSWQQVKEINQLEETVKSLESQIR